MSKGWIKVHRKIQDNPLWTCEPFSRGQAWIDLIAMANHKRSFFYKRGHKIDVERGHLARSEKELSDRWQWSRTKVRKFLNDLEEEQQIKLQKNNLSTFISITNYDEYQEKEPQTIPQKDTKRTAEVPQKDTYKNVKNAKNEKNISSDHPFKTDMQDDPIDVPKDLQEVLDYCKQINIPIGRGKVFHAYYDDANWCFTRGGQFIPVANWRQKLVNDINRGWHEAEPEQAQPQFLNE
jgi:hypothetical protein